MWVRQGRTDAWIAHKLDVSIDQLERFKRDHDLMGEGAAPGRPADPLSVPPPELDLYETSEEEEEEEEEDEEVGALVEGPDADEPPAPPEPKAGQLAERATDREGAGAPARRRRRGRRGGRRRRRPSSYEATFDHGEEGYGLWLDPAVQDDPVYAEHWAGHRPVEITIEEDQIVIRRAGVEEPEEG